MRGEGGLRNGRFREVEVGQRRLEADVVSLCVEAVDVGTNTPPSVLG